MTLLGPLLFFLLQVKMELSEVRLENEKLLQRIAIFEDEQQKQFLQKIEMANEVQDLMETVHKL